MVTVINKNSPHFGKKGKLVQEFPEENRSLIYVKEDESLYHFFNNELSEKKAPVNKKLRTPKSRKDFYQFISAKDNSRTQIVEVIDVLISKKLFNLKEKEHEQDQNGLCKKVLFDYILNAQYSRNDIISKIREYRNNEFIEFLLPNNSFNPKNEPHLKKKKRKVFRKNKKKIA